MNRVDWEKRIPKDSAAGRRELERQIEARRRAEQAAGYKPTRRGWFFGENALKRELMGQMSKRLAMIFARRPHWHRTASVLFVSGPTARRGLVSLRRQGRFQCCLARLRSSDLAH